MSCEHDCPQARVFPRPIFNRPGLDRIDALIGDYDAMRAHMLARIDAAPELAGWTHRGSEDPGIALVEAAATVGDILAHYQQWYANEAYLRTATWRESVAELVRVLGYRLAPGVGGRSRFALGVSGERFITIPAGFALTATLPSAPKPATFETTAAFDARPALSKFHLYRPRTVPHIVNGTDVFQLEPGSSLALAKGDRILVGVAEGRTLTHTQVLVVEKVWQAFGVRQVQTSGKIACLKSSSPWGRLEVQALGRVPGLALLAPSAPVPGSGGSSQRGLLRSGLGHLAAFADILATGLARATLSAAPTLRAYKLIASSRHFGHNAPPTRVSVDANGRATEVAVPYLRRLDAGQGDPAAPQLRPAQLPLDGEVPEFTAGTLVLVEANFSSHPGGGFAEKRVLERGVTLIDRQSLGWGGMTGASTVLELDDTLALSEGGATLAYADVRGITVHAVSDMSFTLRAASKPVNLSHGSALDFFGTRDDAQALRERPLLAQLPDGPRPLDVQAVDLSGSGPEPRFFRLMLDQSLPLSLFDHDAPAVQVYGNLVEATEGKTEPEAVLGDGDARAVFQTFALPKSPLTWLLDAGRSPPWLPQLEVRVAGLRWQRAECFFGRASRERIYIVREDPEGNAFVQFGDGRTGARLPTGVGNVVARWRTGSGAQGLALQPPSAAKRLPGMDEVWMLQPATGGAPPESGARAREAAPASMQSLGRIVSLADCEAEALQLPGVLKARATWTTLDGTAVVSVTVLTASSDPAQTQALDLALRRALAQRGPARWPLSVRTGRKLRVRLELSVHADPELREDDVAQAIATVLGVERDDDLALDAGRRGLLHWRMRNFGEGLHGSQVLAAVQNVAGVKWVELRGMRSEHQLRASDTQLLTLAPEDLQITFVGDPEDGP